MDESAHANANAHRKPDSCNKEVASKKAAGLLVQRPHFRKELELKLIKKGFNRDIITEVLDDFEERGYINDSDRALFYMDELKRKRYGRTEAVRRLIMRGMSRDSASKAASTFFLENDEIANIKYLLDKRRFDLKDPAERVKAFNFLMRRGFGSDLVRRVLKIEDQ
ncbi:MAG: RecX family transcriptional regulator [Pseudomonadota bacterium]